jgi:quercetin dioxygenase-like cupin family protein
MFNRRLATISGLAAAGIIASAAILHGASGQPQDTEKECQCIFLTPDEMNWAEGPASLPPGARFAILEGDPAREGPFTLRVRVPAGYRIPPHSHPADEHVTVLQGTLNFGKGDTFDRASPYTMPAGSFVMIPAGDRHYAWCDQETVIQLHGIGPWDIIYVNPEDDPRQR